MIDSADAVDVEKEYLKRIAKELAGIAGEHQRCRLSSKDIAATRHVAA